MPKQPENEIDIPILQSRKREGRHEYEIAPDRWVSRQRLRQLRNPAKANRIKRESNWHRGVCKPWVPGGRGRPPIGANYDRDE